MRDGVDPQQDEPASALLWDLDNVTTRRRDVPETADALSAMVGPQAPRIAAAQRSTFRASRTLLAQRGFEVLSGGRRLSGADWQLLARAQLLHRQGVRRFVLASNDGDLARLAKLGHLHVITTDASRLSAKLVGAADAVSVVVLGQRTVAEVAVTLAAVRPLLEE